MVLFSLSSLTRNLACAETRHLHHCHRFGGGSGKVLGSKIALAGFLAATSAKTESDAA